MLEGLNEKQKEAVLAEGHVLLTACPGSGKTRVLTYKIAHELQKLPYSKRIIVAVTFTNRAAEEIKSRLLRMNIEPDKLWAGTIHSFCLEWILRPYAGYLDELKNGFVIADEYKSEEIIDQLKEEWELEGWVKPSTKINADGSLDETEYVTLIEDYHEILIEQKLIDFDQMLYFSFKLLNQYPAIAQTLSNLFHLVCVDEYQDTQELQYAILSKIIAAKNGKTKAFVVGDKDQAIYGSLGGIAKSAEELKIQFGNVNITEKELSGNYRSTQRIIDFYSNFQSSGIDIDSLCGYAADRGLIGFSNQDISRDDLENVIAELIKKSLDAGIPENEICVLAPQWQLVIPMGRKLKRLLPSVNFDALGLSPLQKNRENTWFKFARLFLVTPSPNMYFIRNKWAEELLKELENIGIVLWEDSELRPRKLLKVLNAISSTENDGLDYLRDCFEQSLTQLGIEIDQFPQLKFHRDYFFEGAQKRLDREEFDYARDIANFKRLFMHKSGVVVNTCHGIKGEEFHTVIAFGLLNGYIPNWNEYDKVTSARKLLYVICSRAKKELYLISENGRTTRSGNPYYTTPLLNGLTYSYDAVFQAD